MTATIQETLAAVEAGNAKRVAALAKDRRSFVEKLAKGGAVAPDLLVSKLGEWNCSPETFRAEVEQLAKRLALRAEFDSLDQHRRDFNETNAKLMAANREYEASIAAANAKLNEVVGPLEADLLVHDGGVKRAIAAGEHLVQHCPYSELIAKRDAAHKRLCDANNERARLVKSVQESRERGLPQAQAELKQEQDLPEPHPMPDSYRDFYQKEKALALKHRREHVEFIQGQIRENEEVRIPAAQAEAEKAQAEFDSIQAEFAIP